MKKKLLVAAIASALVSPTAFAAEGADGMTYTSASEGFYGTLRVRYDTGSIEDDEANLGPDSAFSRVGVRGTTDMGNGLTGTYQWEARVWNGQGGATGTRQLNVGIDGGFGSVKFGSQNDNMLDVYGRTDVTNSVSGQYTRYRVDNAAIYRTPDLNGFTGSLRANLDGTAVAPTEAVAAVDLNGDGDFTDAGENAAAARGTGTEDENAVDQWAATANYSVAGLTASLGYEVTADGFGALGAVNGVTSLGGNGDFGGGDDVTGVISPAMDSDDSVYWGMGLDYSQDNWNVAVFYTEREVRSRTLTTALIDGEDHDAGNNDANVDDTLASATINVEDQTDLSISGNVTVGKTSVMAFTETRENINGVAGNDETRSGVGVQYAFSTQSRVWMDYLSLDQDSSTSEDDKVVIGLRHDF